MATPWTATMAHRARGPRNGLTLLEVLIAGTILSLVLLAAMNLFRNTNETVGEALIITDTAQRANRLAKRIREELSKASQSSFILSNTDGGSGYNAITYSPLFGDDSGGDPLAPDTHPMSQELDGGGFDFEGGRSKSGLLRRISFQLDQGEQGPEGDDDDGDGVSDDGALVLSVDADDDGDIDGNDPQRAELGHGVLRSSLEIDFQHASDGSPAGSATVGGATQEVSHLSVTFEVHRRMLRPQGSAPARIHVERRQVRVPLRN